MKGPFPRGKRLVFKLNYADGIAMTPDVALDNQIILALRRISQAIDTYSRYLWHEHGLTAPQLGTMRELERRQQATPSELAENLHISPATIAGILKRLEARKLVSRLRDPIDRRSFVVQLTDHGKQLCSCAPSLLRDRFRRELDRLDVWERTQILATLQRVASMMGAEDVQEAPFFFNEQSHPDQQNQTNEHALASMAASPDSSAGISTMAGALSLTDVQSTGAITPRRERVLNRTGSASP